MGCCASLDDKSGTISSEGLDYKGQLVSWTMADRAAGALRWGVQERRLVEQYLNDGKIDPTKVSSASYLRGIKVQEALWDRHTNKNFYQNVRRAVALWQANQPREGGRRAANVEEDDDDSGDDFEPNVDEGDGNEDRE